MNWLDILILVPMIWGAFKGLVKGIVAEGLSIIGIIGGLFIANKFSGLLAETLNWNNRFSGILAFVVLMAFVLLLVYVIIRVMNKSLETIKLQWLNKLGGMVFGAIKWALVFSVVLYLWDLIDEAYPVFKSNTKKESKLYPIVSAIGKKTASLNYEPIKAFLQTQKDSIQ
jgi:membrane protein required for colicin V production